MYYSGTRVYECLQFLQLASGNWHRQTNLQHTQSACPPGPPFRAMFGDVLVHCDMPNVSDIT
jgi:hypothetical protein